MQFLLSIIQGFVYERAPDFFTNESGWLGYFEEKLFFFPVGKSEETITVLDPKTLKVETTFELEGKRALCKHIARSSMLFLSSAAADCQGPQCLFCDSEGLGQIMAKKEVC